MSEGGNPAWVFTCGCGNEVTIKNCGIVCSAEGCRHCRAIIAGEDDGLDISGRVSQHLGFCGCGTPERLDDLMLGYLAGIDFDSEHWDQRTPIPSEEAEHDPIPARRLPGGHPRMDGTRRLGLRGLAYRRWQGSSGEPAPRYGILRASLSSAMKDFHHFHAATAAITGTANHQAITAPPAAAGGAGSAAQR